MGGVWGVYEACRARHAEEGGAGRGGLRKPVRHADKEGVARGQSGIVGLTLRGAVGNAVFQRCGNGLMVRERVVPRDAKSPRQMDARARMDEVGGRWADLTDAEFRAWTEFARTGGYAHGWAAFLGLTSKWLIVNPGARWEGVAPPRMPPVGPFYGDNVTLSLGEAEPGETGLIVQASQGNARGVCTEVVVQRLANARRAVRDRDWRSAGFVEFTDAGLRAEVAVAPGAWAVGYRFVLPATGQQTTLTALGAVTRG